MKNQTYARQSAFYPLVVLVGPMSSGKSELAVKIAKKFGGEIISADSRQIYKKMNLGTGKIAGKWRDLPIFSRRLGKNLKPARKKFVYKDIIHHCIDYVGLKRQYSAALFKRDAQKAIYDILKSGKLPILCGGTGHWVDAVVYNQELPDVKPNAKLRTKLEKQSAEELYKKLAKLDPGRAKTIDKFNKRRLIRALEIILTTGKPVPFLPLFSKQKVFGKYKTLWLGIKTNQADLYKKIKQRLKDRLKAGMVKEILKLHDRGLSWKRLGNFGLEYRYVSRYLQSMISYDNLLSYLTLAIQHYSKRQLTWWKKNKEIKWIKPQIKTAAKFIKAFLSKRKHKNTPQIWPYV